MSWVLGLVLLLLCSCGQDYEEKEREIGYKGVAKIDHFLAASRFAREMGFDATSYAGAPSLSPPDGATLVMPIASLRSNGQLEDIAEWLMEGGNLIVYLSLEDERNYNLQEEEDFRPFLDYFGFDYEVTEMEREVSVEGDDESEEVTVSQYPEIEWVYHDRDEPFEVDFEAPYYLIDTEVTDEEEYTAAFLYYEYGEGNLTVIATAQPFVNRSLGKAEHASLLWDLLKQSSAPEVWFVHSTRVSFFKLLWSKAPQAVVFLLLTIVLLVWWASRGFGPKFIRGTDPEAKLDEHLAASGAFFLKYKADALVVESLRRELFRKLARAVNLPFNSSRSDLLAAAQTQDLLSGVEQASLTEALSDKTLLTTLRNLQLLHKKL